MNATVKKILIIVSALILLIFLLLIVSNQYKSSNKKEKEKQITKEQVEYFQDEIITLGIEDIGMPIEGFDAALLTQAFPGLIDSDFNNVKTLEGRYRLVNGEVQFQREGKNPISSAEMTISREGYHHLLINLSERLKIEPYSEENIDTILDRLNTKENLSISLNDSKSIFGLTLTPVKVLEDSRCPIDVTCIQAGTVRVLTRVVDNNKGSDNEQTFEKNIPVINDTEVITLTGILPEAYSDRIIEEDMYIFIYEIEKKSLFIVQ